MRLAPRSSLVAIAAWPLLITGCGPDTDLFGGGHSGGGGANGTGGDAAGASGTGASGTGASGTGASGTGGSGTGTSTSTGTETGTGTNTGTSTSTGTNTGGTCGDGICGPNETPQSCPADCGVPCSHDVCESGPPLVDGCNPCVGLVCQDDPFCCTDSWDGQCVQLANQICGIGCCGNGVCGDGEGCNNCPQDCGTCVCGDGNCLGETCDSCPQDCGVCADCPHTVCFQGGPLDLVSCADPCVEQVCNVDPSCCGAAEAYDADCKAIAANLCPGGNPCVAAVCANNQSCCTNGWSNACVNLAISLCNTTCACAHSVCQTGGPLDPACNPCVADVCLADDYCCNSNWDGICVAEVALLCGVDCSP